MPSIRFRSMLMAVLLGACASVPVATPEEVAFAPSLNIDLDAMQRLPSGIYYREMAEGAGEPAQRGQWVRVHYVGWLPDGTQFDAAAPPAEPVRFRLGSGDVIRGWDQGVAGMRPGGQRMLVLPAGYGYGRAGSGTVPPNSVLVFLIERVE